MDTLSRDSAESLSPRVLLQKVWEDRFERNPSYSRRAFAKSLSIPPGRLSELMSGKRAFTASHLDKIATALALPSEKRRAMFAAWVSERQIVASDELTQAKVKVSDELFAVIAEWPHYAILSLVCTSGFRPSYAWVAMRLGISAVEVRTCVDRLVRCGLLLKLDRRWVPTHRAICTDTDVYSAALRRSHRESLEQAIDAIESVPLLLRHFTSTTMAIDPAKLPQAKRLIESFHAAMETLLESGTPREVYNLNIQLIPVTRTPSRPKPKGKSNV